MPKHHQKLLTKKQSVTKLMWSCFDMVYYGLVFGFAMSMAVITIIAAQHDYVITLHYNWYGEGFSEYVLSLFLVVMSVVMVVRKLRVKNPHAT